MARLERLAHEKFIVPSIARLLEELRPYQESLPYESDEASLQSLFGELRERLVPLARAITAQPAGGRHFVRGAREPVPHLGEPGRAEPRLLDVLLPAPAGGLSRSVGLRAPDTFYRAVNKVQPSLIRTDADEVTYNLHVMLRFDLELAMLEGSLAVKDLPEAWNERMRSDLGVTPPDDQDGVLQDVHWFGHHVGGVFQGYTLGNIMAAQFYARAREERPSIPNEMESGEFGGLLAWLRQNLYRHGRKFTADELVERVTGGPLSIEPYMRYLETKYGELYEL